MVDIDNLRMNTDIASGSDIPGAAGGNLVLLLTHNIQKQTVLNVHKLTGSLTKKPYAETILNNYLVQHRIEMPVKNEPGRIIDEGYQVNLLLTAILADGQIWSVLYV